jgi:hypothetical protein
MKLRTSISPIRLRLVALSKRLAVAVGNFIKTVTLVDTTTTTDNLNRAATKPLNNSATATEVVGITPNKSLTNLVGMSGGGEYFAEDYVVGAPSTQTYTLGTLSVELLIQKPIPDAILVASADVKTISFQRSFSDTISVADNANTALAQVSSLANQAALLDADRKYVMSKILAEIPAAASSGTLYSQDYTVDMSYFADDYVGESRAFS